MESISGGGMCGRDVYVVEREDVPVLCGHRYDSSSDIRGNFLPSLLIVRDVSLRHADSLSERDLRHVETLADLEDVVHGPDISTPVFASQQSDRL